MADALPTVWNGYRLVSKWPQNQRSSITKMFALSALLLAGGLAYTGSISYRRLNSPRPWRWRHRRSHIQRIAELPQGQVARVQRLTRANHTVTLSSISLGITVTGLFLKPVLMLISVPAALFIFAPTLQDAWQTLRREHRITPSVLDATRVTLCIVMGFYFALALDTWLRALAQRLFTRSDAELQELLDRLFVQRPQTVWCFRAGVEVQTPLAELAVGEIVSIEAGELIPVDGFILYGAAWINEQLITGYAKALRKTSGDQVFASTVVQSGRIYVQVTAIGDHLGTDVVRERVEHMISSGTYLTQAGVQSGRLMAPQMWAIFALLLPFWEANRAAGFLTTSFGSQMERLGPFVLQNFATVALQQKILVCDGRVLESLNLVNTIIIEAAIMADESLRKQAVETIAQLRRRQWPIQSIMPHRFAVYLLADGDEATTKVWADTLEVDDYFIEPLVAGRAELLHRLQISGRFICYVGSGAEAATVTENALVTVAIPSAKTSSPGGQSPTQGAAQRFASSSAQVLLIEKDFQRLEELFSLSTHFGASQ